MDRLVALQRAVGNAAFSRVVQREPAITYPRNNEAIRQPDYTVNMDPDPDTNNMRLNIDSMGPAFHQARQAGGHWYFDWHGFALGRHQLVAEAWNAAGQRQTTRTVNAIVVPGKRVANVAVGVPSYPNRLELVLTLHFDDGSTLPVTMHVSQYRHLTDEYFNDTQETAEPPITTLVNVTRPAFALAFREYAQLLVPHLLQHGMGFRPRSDEFNLNTPSNIGFHSDTNSLLRGEMHCFPTIRGGLCQQVPVDEYIGFKHLARLHAYLATGVDIPATAVARAQKNLALAAVPWCTTLLGQYGINNYVLQVLNPADVRSKQQKAARDQLKKPKK